MSIRRKHLARFLCRSNLLTCLFSRATDTLIVLGYHRIRPDTNGFSTPFDDFVFGPTASELAAQLRWLKQNALILSENDLADLIRSRRIPPRPSVLVTFDDAYRDNYTLALPILKALAIPAIFFISTQQIISRTLGLWDIIPYLLRNTSKEYLRIDGRSFSMQNERDDVIRLLQARLKTLDDDHTHALVRCVENECGVPLPDMEIQDRELMTWEHIIEASRHNVAIGSHTHTHRPLAMLDAVSQMREMRISKLILEQKTGKRVRSIAYPFGGHAHFTPHSRELARDCGYTFAFSFGTGINRWKTMGNHNIRRIAAPEDLCSLMAGVVLRGLFLPGRG